MYMHALPRACPCTCMHARTRTCTYMHAHARVCTHLHERDRARVCASEPARARVRTNERVHVLARARHERARARARHEQARARARTNEHVRGKGTGTGRTPNQLPGYIVGGLRHFLLGLVRTSVNPLSTTGVGSACARRSSHCGRDWPPQCLFVTKVVTREENSQKVKNIKIHFGRKWSSQNAAPGCGNHSSLWLKVVYNCCGQRATRKLRSIGPHFAIYQNRSGAEHHSCTRLDAHSGRIFAFYRHETTDGASIDCSAHPYLRVASSKYLEDYHGQAVYGVIHTSHRASAFEPLDYPCPRSSTGFLRIRPNVLPIRH